LSQSNTYLAAAGGSLFQCSNGFNVNSGGITTGTNKLMGGFWSDISKKTNGQKRTPLQQAKMQLAQQLEAALLNKIAFGSDPGGTVLQDSISAFCTGTNANTILSKASALDAFNNSGDAQPFPAGYVNSSADSKAAQKTAYKGYWD
jgi:hypothetical protein